MGDAFKAALVPTRADYIWAEQQTAAGLGSGLRRQAVEAGARLRARQRAQEVAEALAHPGTDGLLAPPPFPYLTARLLAERGFWSLTPSAQLTLFEWGDIQGRLEIEPSQQYGPPGVLGALVMNALASRWLAGARNPAEPTIAMSATEIASTLGITDTGHNLRRIVGAVESLKRTTYCYIEEDASGGRSDSFSLLDRVQTRWQGPPTSPHRRIRAHLSGVVVEALAERRMIRSVDVKTLRALGEQRELARRLFVFLESRPGHREAGWYRIEHLIDERLAGTLGSRLEPRDLRIKLTQAARAIERVTNGRYRIEIAHRQKTKISPGEPRYLMRALRQREPPAGPRRG